MELYYGGYDIDNQEINKIVKMIAHDIVNSRPGELYDDDDVFEATEYFFDDFLSNIRFEVNKEIEKYHLNNDGCLI